MFPIISLVTLCDYAPCPARMFNMLKNIFIGMFLEHFSIGVVHVTGISGCFIVMSGCFIVMWYDG